LETLCDHSTELFSSSRFSASASSTAATGTAAGGSGERSFEAPAGSAQSAACSYRTLSGCSRRIDPTRLDSSIRCGACRALYLVKRRSGAGRQPTVGRQCQVAVRYPDVVKWMDQNLEWTTQVGEAFLDQPTDVMNTIQQLRAQDFVPLQRRWGSSVSGILFLNILSPAIVG
jgi:Protein of unknown function (DUF3300)